METNELIPIQPVPHPMIIETLDLEQAQKAFKNLQEFVKSQMRQNTDWGIIPGCKKPSLWKPGAEKLLFFHGLGCKLDSTSDTVVDWARGFFNYCYRATVYNPRTGAVIATADGSCNSKEAKYAYLWLAENKLPRGIKKEDCESKEGKYSLLYRTDNPDIFSLVNTIQKMASKRALVAATLMACRASDIFTQDESEEEEHAQKAPQSAQGASQAPPPPAKEQSEEDPVLISDKQRRLVYAVSRDAKIPDSEINDWLASNLGYTVDEKGEVHTSRIKAKDFDGFCKWLKEKQNYANRKNDDPTH